MIRPEQVANLMVANGVGRLGRDVFVHAMPETVTQGWLILGKLDLLDIDWDLPTLRKEGFQILARHPSPLEAEKMAMRAARAVSFHQWRDLPPAGSAESSIRALYIRPRHDPIVFPRSEGDIYEASVNFEFVSVT